MKIRDIISMFDAFAPVAYQESYDNSGLILGMPETDVSGILLSIDVTEEVIEEARTHNCNLIVCHHPLIFGGLKKLTGSNHVERTVLKAIRNDIAVFASHTSMDAAWQGVNERICRKLGLVNLEILSPLDGKLRKLVTFVPEEHAEKVRQAVFKAGAGQIGDYDSCSFHAKGLGSFRGSEHTNPFAGEREKLHFEPEIRLETIFPMHLQAQVINALNESHPYEEVAYDIYPLENSFERAGIGMTGELENPLQEQEFLSLLKTVFQAGCIRHSPLLKKTVKKVAVCGGSGSFLIKKAIASGAQFFVTGDIKYHQFFDAEGRIVIADTGHYESEQYTTEIFHELILKNFPNFAIRFSKVNTNPIKYF
jgi:dinuclear metal center YbgI/SA1388 family protein